MKKKLHDNEIFSTFRRKQNDSQVTTEIKKISVDFLIADALQKNCMTFFCSNRMEYDHVKKIL